MSETDSSGNHKDKDKKRIDALAEVFGNLYSGAKKNPEDTGDLLDIEFTQDIDFNKVNWKEILDDIDVMDPTLYDILTIYPLLDMLLRDYIEGGDETEEGGED